MRKAALGLLILGVVASALLTLGATSQPGSFSEPAATLLYSLRLIDPKPLSSNHQDRLPEDYELTISYRDAEGNQFIVTKPMGDEPASIQGRFSQRFWSQKLEPLLRSLGSLFKISLER
jgi:hypothetical protein